MKFSLIQKITIALVGVSMIGGVLITLLLYSAVNRFEQVLLDESIQSQMALWVSVHEASPELVIAPLTGQKLFKYTDSQRGSIPEPLRLLGPGSYHDVKIDGKEHHILIERVDEHFFALVENIDEIEKIEDLAGFTYVTGILLVGIIMFVLLFWTTRKVVDPVINLAADVKRFCLDEKFYPIAHKYRGEEISQIAQAIDAFRKNLAEFVERERMFTAAASHELRTPVAVISSSNELLQCDPRLSELGIQLTSRIQRSVVQMQDMITSLLFLARDAPAGLMAHGGVPINVSEVIKDIVEAYASIMTGTSVDIVSDVEEGVFFALEESHLRMVANNLLRNAESHTKAGTVKLSLTPDKIIISDTGSGIDPDHLKRVFQRNVSDWQNQGLGFGLYLSKQLCDRNGWELRLTSTVGEGTVATLKLA